MNATRFGRLAVTSLAFAALVVPGLAATDDAADCAKETGEDAIAACTRRIESGEAKAHELAVMFAHRGLAVRRMGDIDRAIADFGEAIRLDPNFAEPVFRRAMVWAYNRNEVERALTDLDQAIVLDPGSALCKDGQIFRLVNHVWQRMPPVPQDEKPKPGFIQIADEPGG